jgi:hypothetical protein
MTDQPQPTPLPEWIATMVGRLVLENEALRQALAEMQQTAQNGHVPAEVPVS